MKITKCLFPAAGYGTSFLPATKAIPNMVEKPDPKNAPSNLAVIGRYILTPDIFEILANQEPGKGGEIQLTDALQTQASQGCVIAYKFKGKRYDCGSMDGFVKATDAVYEKQYTYQW